ncbi:MAG: DEAD/DEAH box helicase family protein [Bacteroidales bacterium]|nr:DEAD/DEAH box helicase family protein [Bacteroidales bacterium]
MEDYLDKEIEHVEAFAGPKIQFSHIESDTTGLRPYQQQMKEDVYSLWDKMDNLMIQMPTGTGKTIVFTSVVRDIQRWCKAHSPESKILIVAHRKELILQASSKLKGIPHGIIMSGNKQDLRKMVQVASIQTFMSCRNYERMRQYRFDFIIIDEAHHSIASGYQKLWEMYPHSKKLGVTATPWRMNHCGFRSLFSEIVLSKPIEWFVNQHYLSNYDYISIRRNSETQKAVNSIDRYGVDGDYLESELSSVFDCDHIRAELYKSYKKFANGKKGIIYAIDRRHAANILNLYSSHGVRIRMIDGTTPVDERQSIIDDFKAGVIRVIVNVNIFSEGFDCPDIEFVQLARPTRSLAMYLQQVGRALRISEGKEKSLILDNVGLYNRFGTPMANRFWRHHFEGSETKGEDGWNDGCLLTKDIDVYDREPDYSEGDEEMEIVEHTEGKKQIRSSESEDTEQGINEYNVFRDRKTGLYGVCDRRNRTVVPPMYEEMHPYFKGYIPFKFNGKWGIMLKNGIVKVKPKYFYIGPFIEGIAEVKNTEYSPSYHINGKLEKID